MSKNNVAEAPAEDKVSEAITNAISEATAPIAEVVGDTDDEKVPSLPPVPVGFKRRWLYFLVPASEDVTIRQLARHLGLGQRELFEDCLRQGLNEKLEEFVVNVLPSLTQTTTAIVKEGSVQVGNKVKIAHVKTPEQLRREEERNARQKAREDESLRRAKEREERLNALRLAVQSAATSEAPVA